MGDSSNASIDYMNKFFYCSFFLVAFSFGPFALAQQTKLTPSYLNSNAPKNSIVKSSPSQDSVRFYSTASSNIIKTVTLYSLIGQKLANYEINAREGVINTQHLRSGKYLFHYSLENNKKEVYQYVKD